MTADTPDVRHAVTRVYRTAKDEQVNVIIATYSDRGQARADIAAVNTAMGFPLVMLVDDHTAPQIPHNPSAEGLHDAALDLGPGMQLRIAPADTR